MAKPKAKAKKPAAKATKPAAKPAAKKPAAKKPAAKKPAAKKPTASMGLSMGHTALLPVLTGIRSVIVKVPDLERAKRFYQSAFGKPPYFDQPFYVGFDIDGQELGLDPDVSTLQPGPGGAVAFWQVVDIFAVFDRLTGDLGGGKIDEPHDVGGGIKVGTVADPFGNLIGLIQMA
jgi:predicted enzyme related to lactoylglutathione lyase